MIVSFLVFLSFSSLPIVFRPITNGNGAGFSNRHWRWSFAVRQIRQKVSLIGIDR